MLRILGATALGVTAVAGFKATTLIKTYPLRPPSEQQLRPGILATIPPGIDMKSMEVVSTIIPIAPNRARLDPAGPVPATLEALYSTWTLRFEAWLARKTGFVSQRPSTADASTLGETYADGVFQVIHREPDSVTVAWSSPGAEDNISAPEGVQVIGAKWERGELEISLGCAQDVPESNPYVERVIMSLHHLYMRYLIDGTRKKLVRMAEKGE